MLTHTHILGNTSFSVKDSERGKRERRFNFILHFIDKQAHKPKHSNIYFFAIFSLHAISSWHTFYLFYYISRHLHSSFSLSWFLPYRCIFFYFSRLCKFSLCMCGQNKIISAYVICFISRSVHFSCKVFGVRILACVLNVREFS